MNRPAFQFYVSDWQRNIKLRRCSHAEKGIWLDVLCLMHDSDQYGILRWTLKEIAEAVGCRIPDLLSLHRKDVLKGAGEHAICEAYIFAPRHAGKSGAPVTLIEQQPGPIWFSSRMVRDEYIRARRGASTRFKEHTEPSPNNIPNHSPKVCNGDEFGDGPSTSSSTSKKINNKTSPLPPSLPDEVLKKLAGKEEAGSFDILQQLDDFGMAVAKAACEGWDITQLAKVFNQNVRSGKLSIPHSPAKAFPAWLRRYTKGRKP